jgi:hypothetical protein
MNTPTRRVANEGTARPILPSHACRQSRHWQVFGKYRKRSAQPVSAKIGLCASTSALAWHLSHPDKPGKFGRPALTKGVLYCSGCASLRCVPNKLTHKGPRRCRPAAGTRGQLPSELWPLACEPASTRAAFDLAVFLFIPWVPSGPAWIERGDVKHCQGDAPGPCTCGQRTRFARHWVDREGRRSPQDPHEGAGSGASNRANRDEHLADPFLSNPLPFNYRLRTAGQKGGSRRALRQSPARSPGRQPFSCIWRRRSSSASGLLPSRRMYFQERIFGSVARGASAV